MDISDWAKNLVERKKKELEDRRIKEEKEAREQQMLDERIWPMWEEVRQSAQKATEELNNGMGFQYISFLSSEDANRFNLKVENTDYVVRLDRLARTIQGARGKTYTLVVIGNSVVWRYEPVNYTSEQIARDQVQQAFEGEDLEARAAESRRKEAAAEAEKKNKDGNRNKDAASGGDTQKREQSPADKGVQEQAKKENKEPAR